MLRLRALVLALALALVGAGPVPFAPLLGEAAAQERKRPNLLDVLRGKPKRAKPKRTAPRRVTKQRATKRRATKQRATKRRAAPRRATRTTKRRATQPKRVVRRAKPTAAAAATPAVAATEPAAEKVENAKTLLVVGDFLADGLADGLAEAFAAEPGIRVVNAANPASGIVRDDYYDWTAKAAELIEEHEPSVVVVQLGANDRQPLREDGTTLDRGSEEWLEAYRERLDEFAETVSKDDRSFVWVGTPSFRQRSLTADMATFNAIYAAVAERAGGTFVDIWDGFVDQNGAYVRTGPDINGQVVRLRGKDGINLSRAGKRKMAFFAEKDILRALGDAPLPGVLDGEIAGLPPLGGDLLEAPLQPRMTPPVSLDDPSLDGGTALLGDGIAVSAPERPRTNPALAAPEDGPPSDRADNFAWPPNG